MTLNDRHATTNVPVQCSVTPAARACTTLLLRLPVAPGAVGER